MNPYGTRRGVLERLRRGELTVAEAKALIEAGRRPGEQPDGAVEGADLVCFRPGWEQRDIAGAGTVPPDTSSSPVLLVLDPAAAQHRGAENWRPSGAVLVRAGGGSGFRRTGPADYRIGLAEDADWTRLWRDLAERDATPERVVLVTGAGPENCLDAVYPLLRAAIRRQGGEPLRLACAAVGPESEQSADTLGGFCSVAAQEDSRLRPVALAVGGDSDPVPPALAELERDDQPLDEVAYEGPVRRVRVLLPEELPARPLPGLPEQGVYLMAGGAGGIGLRLAVLLAQRSRARLVLLGRSEPGPALREATARIENAGGRVGYVRGDVTRPADVRAAVDFARAEFGPVTGVLHLAGVNEDAYIVNKPPGAHARVLAPKLRGARVLDEATRDEPLGFFVLFSSMAGYLGHAGQSDYAAAGRSLGGFAAHRAARVARGERRGTTVSIGWPLWSGGGMRLSEADRRAVESLQGMVEMPPETGLLAMTAALRTGAPELVVVHGDAGRIGAFAGRRLAPGRPDGRAEQVPAGPAGPVPGDLREAAQTYLLGLVSEMARLRPGQLGADQEFSTLGIDSVMIRRLSVALEDGLGPLPATLMFEHRTVRDLARHLAGQHAEPLRALLGAGPDPAPAGPEPVRDAPAAGSASKRRELSPDPAPPYEPPRDAIAIVGVAGRYPGAADVDELWTMLAEGKDAIREIPAGRWDKDRWTDTGDSRPGTSYGRWGGFLDDVSRFDSLFFAVAPREARRMDPAERLFLEVAWSAIENAGYSRARLHHLTRTEDGHSVGVFVGTTGMAYGLVGAEEWGKGNPVPAYSMEFSLANRLSYLLDVHGPSMAVDTACSASLTALHLACESLRHGECRMAVAGGAYLNLHPMKFAMLAEQRMMSPDGVCRAFGEGGDGFVPGEGVGAVVLKPLGAALADGDHVHAVIRSTAVRHGGRTNGYTVPSPRGHASVIGAALRGSGIDPRTIGYVEAHGTGTELGDPIEIDGLSRAFAGHTAERQFCSLGSVKPNIGHAEAAAGIAGLTKILLQLRHRTLAPTLNSDPPNPKIDFPSTPFRLQRTAEPWEPGPGGLPRRAALSSFGAGGANSHAIIEEFVPAKPPPAPGGTDREHLILLSARTPDRLTAVAERLARHLSAPGSPGSLADIAHTLQVGREALEHRLAFVVRSLEELREALARFVSEGTAPFTGRADPSRTAGNPARLGELIAGQRRHEAAELWVRGADADWPAALHGRASEGRVPGIVPLPSYPFAGPSHWPDTSAPPDRDRQAPPDDTVRAPLTPGPPLAGGARYTVELRPTEPVAADHLVAGHPVLAGVAHMELVRAAARQLTGRHPVALSEVRLRSPLVLGEAAPEVRVTGKGETVSAELVTDGPDGPVVHSAARVHLAAEPPAAGAAPDDRPGTAGERLDLAAIRARCPRRSSGTELYERAEAAGLRFGPSYRLVESLWSGDGEALAELGAPPAAARTGWWLEPGVTDAALHTVHGALPSWREPATRPVSVDRVEFTSPSGRARLAYARVVTADPDRGTARCDITLCDTDGRVVTRFTGLGVIRPEQPPEVPYFRPVWRVEPPAAPAPPAAPGPVLVLTAGHDYGLGAALVAHHGPRARLVDLAGLRTPEDHAALLAGQEGPLTLHFLGGVEDRRYSPTDLGHLETSQRHGCLALFHLAKALAATRPPGTRLTVLTGDSQQIDELVPAVNPFAASLHGMARTVARELTFLDTVLLDLSAGELERCGASGDWASLLGRIDAERAGVPFAEAAWRDGTRFVKRLEAARLSGPRPGDLPLRKGGRYLIVGGAGGLGRVIGEHLAGEYGARMLLVGRRPERELDSSVLTRLGRAGGEVAYLRGDVTDPAAMGSAVARMRELFGGVDGVIHTAFVLADRTIAGADDATFRAAFDPKVRGTVALCDALSTEPLDFLALFSSAIAHTGNPGQSNYAAGSTFMDAYGRHLASRLHWPVTVFDWGYWGDQGAVATDEYRERLAGWGVSPLSAAEGVHAFRQALAGGAGHVVPLKVSSALAEVTAVGSGPVHLAEPGSRPSVLPAVAAALRAEQARRGEPYSGDYLDAVDAYGRRAVLDAVASIPPGLGGPGETRTLPDLVARYGVTPSQRPLFEALVTALVNGGYLHRDGDRLETLAAAGTAGDSGERAAHRARLLRRFPHLGPLLGLLDDCAAALPGVLTGARRGLDVLFPGGSSRRVAGLYHDDPRTRHFNALCASAVETAVREWQAGSPGLPTAPRLRILEIGAGTGGTTQPVLEVLDGFADRVAYDVTDISPALTGSARERLGTGRPYAGFRVLDIEGDMAGQGFGEDRYDVVLATNVLHATGDIRRTLKNVASLMRPGALLVVNEATRVLDAVTPVFGLTDGWWSARDPHLRLPHSPLLGPGTWSALLIDAGLRGVCRFAAEGIPDDRAGQHLLVAERGAWRELPDRDTPAGRTPRTAAPPPGTAGADGSRTGDGPRPDRTPDDVVRLTRTVEHLTTLYTELLRLDDGELDPDTPLEMYGADSLTAMEAVERLERDFGPVPKDLLLKRESVRALAAALAGQAHPATDRHRADVSATPSPESGPPEPVPGPERDAGEPGGTAPAPVGRTSGTAAVAAAEPIAIVGVAGRYPMADDLDSLWHNLLTGHCAITEVPPSRWDLADHDDPTGSEAGRSYHRWGGFLAGVDRFDPLLFRISPREAHGMDPAERLFLEVAWEALEDAAMPPSRLRARTPSGRPRVGVFAGVMHHGYQLVAAEQWGRGHRALPAASAWSVANRVSHSFGFTGPSMAVDSACSSALTALHLASASLRQGECTEAVVGGVNVILHPSHHLGLCAAGMLSTDGRSRAFDTASDGMVTGEGAGAVVLKRLSDALRDGDRIHACVIGSAVNADGPTEGYTVPGAEAQTDVIREALRVAGADPGSIQYVEAQATGSPVGDPVELAALRRAYGLGEGKRLRVGSVKPNTGHLEAASGMVQLTKVLLQMRHGTLAPTLGADGAPAPDGFQVTGQPVPWPGGEGEPRRAAVSSFGAGGANAHVIIEEPPVPSARPGRADDGEPMLLLLSARRPDRLRAHARRLSDYLSGPGAHLRLADVVRTLRIGREALPVRLAAVVRSVREAADVLGAHAAQLPHERLMTGRRRAAHGHDEAPRSLPASATEAGLAEAGRAWTEGAPIDWRALDEQGGSVVSLPHYPFARDRYWLDLPAEGERTATEKAQMSPSDDEESSVSDTLPAAETEAGHRADGEEAHQASAAVRDLVVEVICDLLAVSASDIDTGDHLSDFGFDSITMVQLADRLSTRLDIELSPTVLYGFRDLAALLAHLTAARAAQGESAGKPVPRAVRTDGTATERAASPEPDAPPPPARAAAGPAGARSAPPESSVRAGRPRAPEDEPVAVVGMAGVFPGSPDTDAFWDHLVAGHDLVGRPPAGRFDDHEEMGEHWGGFLDGVDRFDAGFFRITPREARVMDPQHRLFLQTVWAAVEEAGYDPADLAGSACGLYVGVASSEYGQLARERGADIDGQLITGNDHSVLANRVSFLLDLHGPSEPVDTACSSSLVAVHRAVSAIRGGECDMAIAGGVNVIVSATGFDAFSRSGMLAPDGRCKTFDHRADGYVRGEGVGAVLLKPLSRARADGDHIHGLITGTATNHGGRAASLTAPTPAAQAEVITRAQQRAGVLPQTIGYVEAHGTGTALGDPIEVEGLRTAFGAGGPAADGAGQYCALGTVKTNVGHLETAAGMAGLVKVLLSLRHRMLAPSLHLERLNPLIELADSPFHLVTSPRPWQPLSDPATGEVLPLRAGLSSFGFGGTNAHLIVEEAPAVPRPEADDTPGPHVFVLSARDPARLRVCAERLLTHLGRLETGGRLHHASAADTAYTLQLGRRPFPARLAVVAGTLQELARVLRLHLDGGSDDRVFSSASGTTASSGADPGAEELAHALARARNGDVRRLAALWADGAEVDWRSLHPEGGRTRVTLPAYPFAPESHWLPAGRPGPRAGAGPALVAEDRRAGSPQPVPPAGTGQRARPPAPPAAPPAPAHRETAPAPAAPPAASHGSEDRLARLRRHVRDAIADGVGITADAIDPAREFAAYGVDSLGAMRIMQTIQARYGDHIPMAAILEHPSVDRLVAHLHQSYVLPDAVPAPEGTPDRARATAPPGAEPHPEVKVVPFADAPEGTPAYCLFGETGELSWVMNLCGHLAQEGPVIGLEAPGFDTGTAPSGDIGHLARQCADAIMERHTEGACRVVGQGVAGYVAAETARLLQDRGFEISELLLLGTPEPGEGPPHETPAASVAEVAASFAAVWGAPDRPFGADEPEDRGVGDRVAEAAARLGSHAPMDGPTLRRWLETAARWRSTLVRSARTYHARPLSGTGAVCVVRAASRARSTPGSGYDRWIAPPPVIHDLDLEPWQLPSPAGARDTARSRAARPALAVSQEEQPSPVVAINRHGDDKRSVWAHNLYGEVSYAIYLSRHLGPRTPVIGLEQTGMAAPVLRPREYASVEEMAAHYAGELRAQFPGESFLLGGCSFGGVLAYEMARKLQQEGEEVSHLIAIDPIMPATEAWDSVDWGTVTAVEAEAFSVVMLGNAMCQRWGVAERVPLASLSGLALDGQLDVVARHIHDRSPARPDPELIRQQILVRHEVMLRNGDLLQAYRPKPLERSVPTTLFHATQGFLAPDNDNELPAVPRTSDDKSNGFAAFVGDRLTIHEMAADHHTIAHNENLALISAVLAPLLRRDGSPGGLFPASLSPDSPQGSR